jgi:hypothetical protein
MSALSDDDAELSAEAVRTARKAVDDAARQLEELANRLDDRQEALDLTESVLDAVLAVTVTPLVVVDLDRRVRALSRAAADRASVGAPLADVVPVAAARRVGEVMDAGEPVEAELPEAGGGCTVRVLVTGHAIVQLAQR